MTLLLANALYLRRSKSLSQGWNWCLCVGGTATSKYTKAEINSQWSGDTFDYLLVLAQENHCHVQESIQQKSFQRQFLFVARKELTFSVKKENVFFVLFFCFFYLVW